MHRKAIHSGADLVQLCPCCSSTKLSTFYQVDSVPVHSVLLMSTQETALGYPVGNIVLGFCEDCGFISNLAFDPLVHQYSADYEETQGFSPTFNKFHRRLAARLVERFDLHNKDIIEIGCGKGEFLALLCELGDNRGVGFDPAYVDGRTESSVQDRITFIKDFYSEKYAGYHGDFVCCKMTLEHIQDAEAFLSTVRRSLGSHTDTVLFFQVPDIRRILREIAFWDIYYEHCSYFSAGSLARLFRRCGFDIIDLAREYDDQYLMIEARPGDGTHGSPLPEEDDLDILAHEVVSFAENYQGVLAGWKRELHQICIGGKRAVIWGAGSKGVAFLTTLQLVEEIEYAVDINPHKEGTYMAGTGQLIVAPDFLRDYEPDVVIVMNPIYLEEIQQMLQKMGLAPEVLTV